MCFKEQSLKELEGLPEFSCWEVWQDSHLADPPSQSLKEDVASGLLWCGRPCPVLVCCHFPVGVPSWFPFSPSVSLHLTCY